MSDARVRSLAATAFPQGVSSVDWGSVVAQAEGGEDICIRASGGFDDKEVALDAFLSDDLLRRIGTS